MQFRCGHTDADGNGLSYRDGKVTRLRCRTCYNALAKAGQARRRQRDKEIRDGIENYRRSLRSSQNQVSGTIRPATVARALAVQTNLQEELGSSWLNFIGNRASQDQQTGLDLIPIDSVKKVAKPNLCLVEGNKVTDVYRPNRKASDEDIIRLNSVGLSLRTIAKKLGCHPTTITLRLQDLHIEPANTRRAFMEGIYENMSAKQQEWLENKLGPKLSIREFVNNLLIEEFIRDQKIESKAA